MRAPLVVAGMHGMGDNLHQRAIIRQLMDKNDVWLESSWVSIYHDLIEDGLKVVNKPTPLRTQAKNAKREASLFSSIPPPLGARNLTVNYPPALVRSQQSVLGAMCQSTGCDYDTADFSLPIPPAWQAKAQACLDRWHPNKPLLIYRPLVDRPSDWTGCPTRNPDHAAYAALFDVLSHYFFVVSIADLVPDKEWMVGLSCHADAICHQGELDFETIAALTQCAGLVYTSPGFAVVLAQAVGTPVISVFGGYERAYSFSGGARHSPYLGIEPKQPCDCFSHSHACNKEIDLPHAREKIIRFAETAIGRSVAA